MHPNQIIGMGIGGHIGGVALGHIPVPVAEARRPEIVAEHELLMQRLEHLAERHAHLADRLSTVRRPPGAVGGNASAAPELAAPMTDVGNRLRAATEVVERLIDSTEQILSEIEV